jgi:hypothetical protein
MKFLKTMALAGLAVVALSACADLAVVNLNDPDRERAISTPGDVESLITGAFRSWHTANYNRAPNIAFSAVANEHAASWGNFGMNDLRRQPREAFNNNPSYGYAYVASYPWNNLYAALSGIRDGVIAIDGGIEIGENGADTPRAMTMARFVQGLALASLAANFDRAFILDEATDLENAQLEPYTAVWAAAKARLEEAIQLANANSFNTDPTWVGDQTRSSADIAAFAHGALAHFEASMGRTVAERDAANWANIMNNAQQGPSSDFTITGDGTCGSCWGDWTKTWGGSFSTWHRKDVEWIGPADQSGEFQAWRALPAVQRNAILIDTDDQRLTSGDPQSDGLYTAFEGVNSSAFRPERGTYSFSDYRDSRWDYYSDNWQGNYPIMAVANMEFLMAEAMIRTGNPQGALDIINSYRTTNGGLPPATLDGVQGQDRCVPKTASGACGDLLETFKYEKRQEAYHIMPGTAFYDDRGWGDLISGSITQLPVPADELLVLLQEIYTFGGAPGSEGSAPTDGMGFDLTLDDLTPEELSRRAQALESFRISYGAKFDNTLN